MALTVLVGFSDAFAAVEAVWSLQRAGMEVVAFGRRGRRSALRRVPGVRLVEVTAPEHDVAATLRELDELVRVHRADAVLPLDDAALWLTGEMDRSASTFVGPGKGGVAWALDKAAQTATARALGFRVPDTTVVARPQDLVDLDLPRIVKPAAAVLREGDRLVRPRGAICADAAELDAARAGLSDCPHLVQPLLRGTGEGVFGYVGPDGPTQWSAHRRVRMVNPHGSASSACDSIDPDPELVARTTALLAALDWQGLFMVELLRDAAGTAWFMEVNGRTWGSLALARRRGYEYPAWAVQAALGTDPFPAPPDRPPHLRCRHLGREILHAAFVARGPRSAAAVESWPGRRQTVRDLLRLGPGERWYNWDARQPRVLLDDTWQTLRGQLAGRRR